MKNIRKALVILTVSALVGVSAFCSFPVYAGDDTYLEVRFNDGTDPLRVENDSSTSFSFSLRGFKITDKDGVSQLIDAGSIASVEVYTPLPEKPDTTYYSCCPLQRPEWFHGNFFYSPRVIRNICYPDGTVDTKTFLDNGVFARAYGNFFDRWFPVTDFSYSTHMWASYIQSDDFFTKTQSFFPRISYLYDDPDDFIIEVTERKPSDEGWSRVVKTDDPTTFWVGALSEDTAEDVKRVVDSIASVKQAPLRIGDLLPALAPGLDGDEALRKLPDGVYGGEGVSQYRYGYCNDIFPKEGDHHTDFLPNISYNETQYFHHVGFIKVDGKLFKFEDKMPVISHDLRTAYEDEFHKMKILTVKVEHELPDGNTLTDIVVDSLYCVNYTVSDESGQPLEPGKWCLDWGMSPLIALWGGATSDPLGNWNVPQYLDGFTGKIISYPDWLEFKPDYEFNPETGDYDLHGYIMDARLNEMEEFDVYKNMYEYGDEINRKVYNVRRGEIKVEKDGKVYTIPAYQGGYDWVKLDVDSVHLDADGGEFRITGTTNTSRYYLWVRSYDYEWIDADMDVDSRFVYPDENGAFAFLHYVATPNPYSTPRRKVLEIYMNGLLRAKFVVYQEGNPSGKLADAKTLASPGRGAVRYSDFSGIPEPQPTRAAGSYCRDICY